MERWRDRQERLRRGTRRRRRTTRRSPSTADDAAQAAPAPLATACAFDEPPPEPEPTGGGVRDMILRFFRKGKQERPEERADVAPGDDPVRRILAVPRGAARLDAFESALLALGAGTHGHRGVALAFHRELVTLAERAGVDLSLLRPRVERCAEALSRAGEVERAAHLLGKIGKKKRAAELFLAAGAIDELEEAHAALREGEGGPHLSARLCYERFEALFTVGQREEALLALEEAARHWPTNPVYGEIAERFGARVRQGEALLRIEPPRKRVVHTLVRATWPLLVGRSADAALRLSSPLVSREHIEVALADSAPVVKNLVGRGVRLDGAPLLEVSPLEEEGMLELSGVEVRYRLAGGALTLRATGEGPALFALLGTEAELMLDEGATPLRLSRDATRRLYAMPRPGLLANGEPLTRPLLLLEGDRLRLEGTELLVLGGTSVR